MMLTLYIVDALIVDIIQRAEANLHRTITEAEMRLNESLAAHCNDPNAHPGHVHELDLSAVRDAVDTALEEVARAVEEEHSQEDHSQESQEGEGEETPPPPSQESENEKPPERTHTLHRRVGG